jgi:hypothetical protein
VGAEGTRGEAGEKKAPGPRDLARDEGRRERAVVQLRCVLLQVVHEVLGVAQRVVVGHVAVDCPGRQPPFSDDKRPARPRKRSRRRRFTVEGAAGARKACGSGPDRSQRSG